MALSNVTTLLFALMLLLALGESFLCRICVAWGMIESLNQTLRGGGGF